jgi:hypothetical protein
MSRAFVLTVTSFLLAAAAPLAAQSATQVVNFRVLVLQHATVQAPAAPMAPRSGAGAVSMGTYAFATNEANRKISASLDQAMPAGSSLSVTMAAPAGAQPVANAVLGTDAVDLVIAIPPSQTSGLPVRYDVRAPNGITTSEQRIVTYTVTAAP